MWLVFIFLVVVLVSSMLWLVWRLRHFSQSNNQTVLDDKLLQNMLGDEALSKEVKSALVGKTTGAKYPVSSPSLPVDADLDEKRGGGQRSSKEQDMNREGKI